MSPRLVLSHLAALVAACGLSGAFQALWMMGRHQSILTGGDMLVRLASMGFVLGTVCALLLMPVAVALRWVPLARRKDGTATTFAAAGANTAALVTATAAPVLQYGLPPALRASVIVVLVLAFGVLKMLGHME